MSSLFGGGSTTVPKVNLSQELTQTLAGLKSTAGGFFNLNQQYAPAYTGLNLQSLNQTLFGSPGIPGEISQQIAANRALQGANIGTINQLGPGGYEALMRSNPGLAQSLWQANQAGSQLSGPGSLSGQLSDTAQQQLSLGGALSPQELDMINQQSRAGFAQRGMFNTNQSLGADLLSQDQFSNQRLGQRLGWAQNVAGLQNQNTSTLGSLAQTNASVYNPYTNILGQSPILGGSQVPLSLMGTLNTQNLFSPSSGNDIFNTNFNAQASQAIANSNQQAALLGAGISAAGNIAGSFASSDKRLKKNIKRVGTTEEGIPIREWSYIGDKRRFVSPTAQDIEKVHPEAVITLPLTGHKLVDFARVKAPFYQLTKRAA